MPEFNRPGVIRYKDNAHLKEIFDQIAKGKIDKVKIAQEGQEYILKERTLSAANECAQRQSENCLNKWLRQKKTRSRRQ
jgi:hypothetical protein